MNVFLLILKGLAVLTLSVGMLHLVLGLQADALLGIEVAAVVADDPGLSSQNRYFGVSYVVFASVYWLASRDLDRFRPVLVCALAITFAAGLSRLLPWLTFGAPPSAVIGLLLLEILAPLALLRWMPRSKQAGADPRVPPRPSGRGP